MNRYLVARADDVPEGGRLIVDVNGRAVGIFRVDGTYHAFLNRCPHQGAQLCAGRVVSHISATRPGKIELDSTRKYLVCPWHGWEFELETGQSYFDPSRMRARHYAVEVRPGSTLDELGSTPSAEGMRKGPYIAEKLEVNVEDDYIVVVVP
jgi:nitrite reductase/ring-hydroxylating ferredoxin subunit